MFLLCLLSFMYFISKNFVSRFTWIHDFEEYLTKSVLPVPFSAQYLICRHVQTYRQSDRQMDRQTDELIWVWLGNLSRFLQVKIEIVKVVSLLSFVSVTF